MCTISSVDTGLALNALAENRSTVAEAHIQVDTGMGFGGFLVGEPEKILLAYRSLPNVALSGIYTQIHAAPAGQEAEHQLQQFQRVLDAIHAAGNLCAGLLGTLGRWRRGRRLYVRVNGQRARVIGSVGVSETLVDVTDLKCSAGDVVSFDLDPMYARGCVRQYR